MPEEKYEPQRRYHAKAILRVTVDFNRNTESELVERIENEPNKAGYIKKLVKKDVEQGKGSK